jgi:hypothetical protein
MSNSQSRRLWLSPEEFDLLTDDGATTIAKGQDNTMNPSSISKDTCEIIFEKFSSKPAPKPLSFLLFNALSVGQEFILVCLLLAGHRCAIMEEQYHHINNNNNNNNNLRQRRQEGEDILVFSSNRLWISLGLVWITLLLSVVQTRFATSKQYQVSMMIRLCIGSTSMVSFSFSID